MGDGAALPPMAVEFALLFKVLLLFLVFLGSLSMLFRVGLVRIKIGVISQ